MMKKVLFLVILLPMLLMGLVHAQDDIFVDEASSVAYSVGQYLPANFPVGMAFADDGTLFYNEKEGGRVRMVQPDGTQQIEPVITLPTDALVERGMLGLALDPDFGNNGVMYVVHTVAGTARDWPANRLVRFTIEDGIAGEPEELLRVPITSGTLIHNGGNIHFDADGYLYWSLGDYQEASNAQDLDTLPGKIHRYQVTEDGIIPVDDNPYGNSIFALGFRNPFDFTFDPETNYLFTTDVGPNCDDEVNLVFAGFNYGWHDGYECYGKDAISGLDNGIYYAPLLTFTPVESPTGIVVYDHDAIPEWQGDLFFCSWNTGILRRVELNEARTQVEAVHEIDLGEVQCRIDIAINPVDGGLYFGTVGDFGGAIMRLMPE